MSIETNMLPLSHATTLITVAVSSRSVICCQQTDSVVARLLFSSLLSALLQKIDSALTTKDAAETLKRISACIGNMLTTTTQFYAPFIACLLVCIVLLYAL